MSPTSTIALPTRPTFRPTAGILAAAVASLIIGAGVITQDVEIGVATATEAPAVAPVTYDPLDFSATVTASTSALSAATLSMASKMTWCWAR